MNMIEAINDYLSPVIGDTAVCLGAWDESPGESATEFLSINFSGGSAPGVISKNRVIELYYVSAADAGDSARGKIDAYNKASKITRYIEDNPASSCFANVILFTGIIGPKETDRKRNVYHFSIDVTY